MQSKDYITALKQGLEKKIQILDKIIEENALQRQLLADPELDPDDFEKNLNDKAALVEQLTMLDDGFDAVYERVREEMQQNRAAYATDITCMQKYISAIMEKSTQIQTEEQRNRELVVQKFASVKKQIREVKSSHKAVNEYYQNMMKLNYVEPQFMDNKK